MGWFKNVFSPGWFNNAFADTPAFDTWSDKLQHPPELPYRCYVTVDGESPDSRHVVVADHTKRWTYTCPDFRQGNADASRERYYCEHIVYAGYITGIHHPMRWRREGSNAYLIGELVRLPNGSLRMSVDGFVTNRELDEVHRLTPALKKRFLPPEPDAIALFGDEGDEEGTCALFALDRVTAVLNSEEFGIAWAKTEQRRAAWHKREALRVRIQALAEKKAVEARAEFVEHVFAVRCTYVDGWIDLSVWAKDTEHAKSLVGRWLGSEDYPKTRDNIYKNAVASFKVAMEEYRNLARYGTDGLYKPVRPKKVASNLSIAAIQETTMGTAHREWEKVEWESASECPDYEAEARAAFGDCVFAVRCTYVYGWIELSVWARDTKHAKWLAGRWLRSEEYRAKRDSIYEDAIDEFKYAMKDYRDMARYGTDGLHKPVRPKKAEFTMSIAAIRETTMDTECLEMAEVEVENESMGWDHDFG